MISFCQISSYRPLECIRCGVCCQKGGPALHHEDKALFEKGVIDLDCLYTIRKDELVYDNVSKRLEPALSDIIKIKGQTHSHDSKAATCCFFNQETAGCEIYLNRPLECRVLKCWDVRESVRIYNKNRLTRKDIIGRIKGLWELIEDHQTQCSYTKFRELLIKTDSAQSGDGKYRKMIDEMIGYDKHLRDLMIQRNYLQADALDFIFGRPLTEGLKMQRYYREL
ncbi:YkgJ family cysteine cluster protein [Desulfococcaceae bacterium HSG9]|nr:YkgJ family cysteine cluster protein [Desulfococcaceae bacterium HSG9]